MSSGTMSAMVMSIVQIVAQNVKAALEASSFASYRALGRTAKVAANTVKNLAEPESREPGKRGEVAPRLDNLDKVARALGYEAWQLLQEDFTPKVPSKQIVAIDPLEKQLLGMYRSLPGKYRDALLQSANNLLTLANPEPSIANPFNGAKHAIEEGK